MWVLSAISHNSCKETLKVGHFALAWGKIQQAREFGQIRLRQSVTPPIISINEKFLRKKSLANFCIIYHYDGLRKVKTNRLIDEKLRFFQLLLFKEMNESIVGEGKTNDSSHLLSTLKKQNLFSNCNRLAVSSKCTIRQVV